MTFDLILSSLYYHAREWFVFQDILTHIPHEKAAVANERSRSTSKYTYRFGITRDWLTGDSKKILVDRHFIDSKDTGRNLIFSSVLIDAERVEELFRESFSKKFRLKVQQFQLTANSLDSHWFEWHFDPKQKESIVKKTKLTVEGNNLRSKATAKMPRKDRESDSENLTPNLSANNNPRDSLKRRRSAMENGRAEENQLTNTFVPTISESVLTRPRLAKRPKERDDEKPDILPEKKEPISPIFTPDIKLNFKENIKRSLSPERKTEPLPSSSPQRVVKDDVMLSSATAVDSDIPDEGAPDASDTPQNSDTLNQGEEISTNDGSIIDGDVSQVDIDEQDMVAMGNIPEQTDSTDEGDIPEQGGNTDEGDIQDTSVDSNNVSRDSDSPVDISSNTDNISVPDSNIVDDHAPQNENQSPSSPTSSLLDNSKNIMANIKLREEELCSDHEEEVIVVNGESSEVPSTSADVSADPGGHKQDCGAESCSTLCLCTDEETSKKEMPAEAKRESTEASELLDGLKAAGFVPLVRQLLENVQGQSDTKLSQMEAELKSLGNQINQKRKANNCLQKNIKRKAGELEKLFENLRKGKAKCGALEQKHRALQVQKSTVEAKVKKCLEVLNSVD